MLSLIVVGDRLYYLAETVTLATILLPINCQRKTRGNYLKRAVVFFKGFITEKEKNLSLLDVLKAKFSVF